VEARVKAAGTALVSGAGRGLGRALALELARRGFDVLATMRDARAGQGLAEAAGPDARRIRVQALDVTKPETIVLPERLSVLVNNAAIETDYLPVEHAPLEAWRAVFETNVFGLVELTRRAIPRLRAAGGGAIVNLTSASLLFPMPFYAVYRASKAAVAALGETLRAELRPFGIRVLEVLPGPVETDLLAESDREPEAAACAGYEALARWAQVGRRSMSGRTTPAAEAARRIADAILDERAPLRVACDDLGAGMIAGADAAPFEARLAGALAAMPAGGDSG
jgi:NAD(P)-dependent dehydrogenase (short-subunit alcohol dehydrogenase family)